MIFLLLCQSFWWGLGAGGIGSQNEALTISFVGGRKISNGIGGGLQITASFTNNAPEYTETSIPHSDYTNLGEFKDGGELGIHFLGHKYIDNFLLIAVGGLSFQSYVTLVESNVTGWNWQQSDRIEFYPVFGGGVGFKIEQTSLCITYTNRYGGLLYLTFPSFL